MVNISHPINLGKNKHQHQPARLPGSPRCHKQTNCPLGSDLSINPRPIEQPVSFCRPAARYLVSILSVVPLYNWHEKMSAELSVNQIETGPSEQDWCKIHNTTTLHCTTGHISTWDLTIKFSADLKDSPLHQFYEALHFITENINVKMLEWCCIRYEMYAGGSGGVGLYHHHEITG